MQITSAILALGRNLPLLPMPAGAGAPLLQYVLVGIVNLTIAAGVALLPAGVIALLIHFARQAHNRAWAARRAMRQLHEANAQLICAAHCADAPGVVKSIEQGAQMRVLAFRGSASRDFAAHQVARMRELLGRSGRCATTGQPVQSLMNGSTE